MNSHKAFLKIGASVFALSAMSSLGATLAFAQDAQPAANNQIEEVVVTGSSIRGLAAPVGSNLMTVSPEDIQNAVGVSATEVLNNMPSITAADSSGRGSSVYIHSLGTTEQSSTLVLLDGNRMATSGNQDYVVDPNEIPKEMIERVDVLAEGASAIYGADAVAGVVNFITRSKYDGVQIDLSDQHVLGASESKSVGLLAGHSWDTGSVVAAFDFSFEGKIPDTARWRTNPVAITQEALAAGFDPTAVAAAKTNFGNFDCSPASIRLNGAGNYYLNAQSTTNYSTAASNSNCSQWAYQDYQTSDYRKQGMIKFTQKLSDNLILTGDMVLSDHTSQAPTSRGILNAVTAFGPGYSGGALSSVATTMGGKTTTTTFNQINPFYANPPGTTSTTQSINYDFDQLFGPGAYSFSNDFAAMGHADLTWNIDDNWSVTLHGGVSRDASGTATTGVINQALAIEALNGTTISSGAVASTPVAGQNEVVYQSLNTSNALDVWNPVATNQTSAATLASLSSVPNTATSTQFIDALEQFRGVANGSLGDFFGAGEVKMAIGAEYSTWGLNYFNASPSGSGGDYSNSQFRTINEFRNWKSVFAEFDIPVVSPAQNVPFVQKLEFDVSGRYDSYSDVGTTKNPKVAVNWEVGGGLRLRANWSTAFVAPTLTAVGDPNQFGNTTFSGATVNTGAVTVAPVAAFPQITLLGIPGCTAASVSCSTPSSLSGITFTNVPPGLGTGTVVHPEKGHGYVLGFDYNPDFLPGFRSAISWWHTNYLGGITSANETVWATNPSENYRITLFPNCATPAQIAALLGHTPLNSTLPSCVSYMLNNLNDNELNFWANGIDGSVEYTYDTGDYGAVTVGMNFSTQFQHQIGYADNVTPTAQYRYEALGTGGLTNESIPATDARPHFGWQYKAWVADVWANYQSAYHNCASPINPEGLSSLLVYNGTGCDHVDSHTTMDLHFGYAFDAGMFGNESIDLSVRNALNQSAPFYNSSTGVDKVSSDIGRVLQFGFTARL